MPVATVTVATGQISPVAIVEITHVATVLICSSVSLFLQQYSVATHIKLFSVNLDLRFKSSWTRMRTSLWAAGVFYSLFNLSWS
jgi:hypothetical protein